MITPEDIRNPDRKSGYEFVVKAGKTAMQNPWRARDQRKIDGSYAFVGPTRATALQAAQDYCDYANNNGISPATTVTLNSAGHKAARVPVVRDDEVEAALGLLRDVRAQRLQSEQGYIYLIGVTGDDWGVKVGYSVNPAARVRELQTGNPRILRLLATFEGTPVDEARLHADYLLDNLIGEWFEPSEELLAEFDLTDQQLAVMLGLNERLTV